MSAVRVALRRIPTVECGPADAAHQRVSDLAVELLAPCAPGRHIGAPIAIVAPLGKGVIRNGREQVGPSSVEGGPSEFESLGRSIAVLARVKAGI